MQVGEHWIATAGGRLFARAWQPEDARAARAPLLLLHDSLGCVALWRGFPEALAQATRRHVVAYDRLGFGRSDPHPGSLAPDFVQAEAVTVAALCDALGIARVVLLGHSVGGGMAVCAAARLPERCAAVVTLAAQAFVEDRTLAGIRAARDGFAVPGQMERLARYHGTKAPWVLAAWTETWLDPRFAGWTLDADLAGVPCPLLALHGDRDEYGSPAHPARIAARAHGPSHGVVIPDCGHVPHRERPEAVLAAVVPFLEEGDAGPA